MSNVFEEARKVLSKAECDRLYRQFVAETRKAIAVAKKARSPRRRK